MALLYTLFLLVLQVLMTIAEGREFCEATNGDDYLCDVGHCCGNEECCTYYYELWWFWLVWFLIVFVIGFCVWQRKNFHPWREQQYRHNSCGLCGPPDLYPDILPIPPVKLPTYAEIGETVSFNTPPPPYTCECYMGGLTTGQVGSYDQPPPESGAPPSYMQIIAPLMTRQQRNNSTGTQFPEGIPSTAITISTEQPPLAETTHSLVQTDSSMQSPDSPCLSCSSPSSPLTSARSCSCSSIESHSPPSSVPARPGHAVSARLVSDLYLKPMWFQHGSFGKDNGLATHIQSSSRLQVPFSGTNFNPCPRCVSRSVSSLRHSPSAIITRDASTSTLPLDPNELEAQTTSQNQEPDRFERRNSYSLPRNFVCSTKLKD